MFPPLGQVRVRIGSEFLSARICFFSWTDHANIFKPYLDTSDGTPMFFARQYLCVTHMSSSSEIEEGRAREKPSKTSSCVCVCVCASTSQFKWLRDC